MQMQRSNRPWTTNAQEQLTTQGKKKATKKEETGPLWMPGHWYFTFIPSSWEDRAKPGFLILLFGGHGERFGAVVECRRIAVVAVHPQRGSWGFLFVLQAVRHLQVQLISQLLKESSGRQEVREVKSTASGVHMGESSIPEIVSFSHSFAQISWAF